MKAVTWFAIPFGCVSGAATNSREEMDWKEKQKDPSIAYEDVDDREPDRDRDLDLDFERERDWDRDRDPAPPWLRLIVFSRREFFYLEEEEVGKIILRAVGE